MKKKHAIEVPKEEQWLFDQKNKEIVEKLKKALKQKAAKEIDLSLFEEELSFPIPD